MLNCSIVGYNGREDCCLGICAYAPWDVTMTVPLNGVVDRCRDDPDYADAIRIETALGIPVLRHDEKKPGGIEEVLAFFEGKDPEGGTVSGNVLHLWKWFIVEASGAAREVAQINKSWQETVPFSMAVWSPFWLWLSSGAKMVFF